MKKIYGIDGIPVEIDNLKFPFALWIIAEDDWSCEYRKQIVKFIDSGCTYFHISGFFSKKYEDEIDECIFTNFSKTILTTASDDIDDESIFDFISVESPQGIFFGRYIINFSRTNFSAIKLISLLSKGST
jgi:hypothetical protein